MSALDDFIRDATCDVVNGAGNHRWKWMLDRNNLEVEACADCGVLRSGWGTSQGRRTR